MSTPRIVIGAGVPNRLAALVCEFSIRKHCPVGVEVIHTWDRHFIRNGAERDWHRDRWDADCEWVKCHPIATLFSYCRLMVPEICGFQGEAIYLDADMLVYADIREVWDLPMGDALVLRLEDGQFSVLKLQCAGVEQYRIRELIRANHSYRTLMNGLFLPPESIRRVIPNTWNCCDAVRPGMRLLHYTNMRTQPWLIPGHRHAAHFFDLLAEAVSAGFIARETVVASIQPPSEWWAAMPPQPHVLRELDARLSG